MSKIEPVVPGYYRNDPSKLTFGELRRWTSMGLPRVCFLWLFRDGLPQENTDGPYLPQYWSDLVTTADQLSDRCMDALLPRISDLERLGFSVVSYQKLKKHNFSTQRDNGGAFLLHRSGDFGAAVVWTVIRLPAPTNTEEMTVATSIFTSCVSGSAVTVGSSKMYVDPPPSRKTICMPGAPAPQLWERIQDERKKLDAHGEQVLKLTTVDDMARWHDFQSDVSWHHQVHVRKVLVRLTDEQAQALGLP